MKLLLENWRAFINEDEGSNSPLDLELGPERKILALKEPWKGFPTGRIKQKTNTKPEGVWYGCGDSWLKWMAREKPEWLDAVNYVYELELDQEFIMTITNEKEFKKFEWEYWGKAPWQGRGGWNDTGPTDGQYEMIDWDVLTGQYDGIEICPYLQQFRMSNSMWYYTWDVASGCIWDSQSLIGEPKLLWQRDTEKEGEEDETPT